MVRSLAIRIALGTLAALAVLVLAFLLFDWNRAKPWLNSRITDATGRPFAINGDLSLDWRRSEAEGNGWQRWIPWPEFTAQDIVFGNPDWASEAKNMAEVGQLRFSLNPLLLLTRTIAIPALELEQARLFLLRTKDGRNNWTLQSESAQPSRWQMQIENVRFREGIIHIVDDSRQLDARAEIDTLEKDASRYQTQWKLSGKLQKQELSGAGKSGALLALREQGTPFPIEFQLKAGGTEIEASGTVTGLPVMSAADLKVRLSGASMAHLHPLTGVLLPHTPHYSTEGQLLRTGQQWTYRDFSGKVGESDLSGSFTFEKKDPRPLLTGDLQSDQLRLQDLGPLIGAGNKKNLARGDDNESQPSGKALPVRDFDTAKWKNLDADVKFRGKKIIRDQKLPFENMVTHLHLRDGVLSLRPLNFSMAGGKLASTITLDGSTGKIKAEMDVAARGLQLKQLFPAVEPMRTSIGALNGDAKLTAAGDSVAALLASSNGEIKALISEGTVSKLILEAIGLNIGSLVVTRLFGDRQVSIHCMASDFSVTDGVLQARTFVLDTEEALINIAGNIDLSKEKLALTIYPENKRLRIFSLRSPLYVRGTFKEPDIGVDKKAVASKALGALALGLAAPAATALLPLVNPGEQQDSGCNQLLQQARSDPKAPPPGKTNRENSRN